MDVSTTDINTLSETDLRDLLKTAQEALDRLIAKRARSTFPRK